MMITQTPQKIAQKTLDELSGKLEGVSRNSTTQALPGELYKAIATYINDRIFSFLIAAAITVTIVFVFYGSFQYFTAYGDENRATMAKKTITYAFVGLLIAFMAMGIASFVQQNLVSENVPTTNVPVSR